MGSVTIAELLTWQPSQLETVSDKLNTRRRSLLDLQDEIDATKPPSDWQSDSGNAARAAHVKLRDDLNDMAAEISAVVVALDAAATSVTQAKSDLQGQLDHAQSLHCTVDHTTGEVKAPPTPTGDGGGGSGGGSSSNEPQVTQAQVNAIADGISRALTAAGQADTDLAGILGKARRDEVDGGTGTIADAEALTTELATMTPQQQAEYYKALMEGKNPSDRARFILDHDEIPNNVVDLVLADDHAAADELGKYVADKVEHIDHDTSTADVQAAVALLQRFQGSHQVSAGIIHQLGGTGLISAISIAGSRLYASSDDEAQANIDLARLTRDVFRSGEPTLATWDPQASRDLAHQMTDMIRDPENNSEQPGNDPVALSYLLRDSTLSTPFLDTTGDELDDFERNVMGPHGGTWSMMSNMQYGATWLFDEGDREGAYDPMASYMSALGHNDEAALQFFDAGGDNPHDASADDRQEYWIKDRRWSHDRFDGLTAALDAATTGHDNLADPTSARASAELASTTVHLLSERSGMGTDAEHFSPGNVSDDGTVHLAHMLSTYMPSVDHALDVQQVPGEETLGVQVLPDERFAGLTNMPAFSGQELKGMADVAVSSEHGFDAMRQGVSTYQGMLLNNSIAEHHAVDAETAQADARLEGFFVNAVGDTEIANAADTDARVQSWIDLGKDVVGSVPVPGGQVVGFLADHAIDAGAEGLSDVYTHHEDAAVDSGNNFATTALNARHEAVEQALVNGGAITPDQVAQTLSVPGSPYSADEVRSWFPDGHFPSHDEYAAMSTEQQRDLHNALSTLVDENHLMDETDYDQTYKNMFTNYFESGDGDGN